MKIVSFNINSIRARLHQVQKLVDDSDVIALQETKVDDPQFPLSDIEQMGLNALFHGQKSHYGVATLATAPQQLVCKGFPDDTEDAQRRFIGTSHTLPDGSLLTIYNGYFPQGENIKHETKFPAKRKFYRDLMNYIRENHDLNVDLVIVLGDLNIAATDLDIGIGDDNKKRWLRDGKASFQPEERDWYQELISLGLTDAQRHLDANYKKYSWFDYRSKGFEKFPKRGLRIDQILLSDALLPRLRSAGIDYDARAMEKPSDHAPIWVELS